MVLDTLQAPSNAPVRPSEVRADRESLALTQRDYAAALGVEVTTVGRWERGERKMESPRLYRLAVLALKTLLWGAETTEPPQTVAVAKPE